MAIEGADGPIGGSRSGMTRSLTDADDGSARTIGPTRECDEVGRCLPTTAVPGPWVSPGVLAAGSVGLAEGFSTAIIFAHVGALHGRRVSAAVGPRMAPPQPRARG